MNILNKTASHKKSLDFGTVFNDTFENYKKIAPLMGVIFFMLMIIYFVLAAGILGLFFGMGNYAEILTGLQTNSVLSTTSLALQTLVKIIATGLLAPLSAGLLKMAHNAEIGEDFGIGTAFEYFKTRYFKDLFIATVLIAAIMNLFNLACSLFLTKNLNDIKNLQNLNLNNFWLVSLVSIISTIIIVILTIYTTQLIIFGQLTAIQAIKQSISLSLKQFWLILLLWIITIIYCCFGFIGFCIGFLFTLPFYFSFIYIIYKNAVGIENTNEIDQIGLSND